MRLFTQMRHHSIQVCPEEKRQLSSNQANIDSRAWRRGRKRRKCNIVWWFISSSVDIAAHLAQRSWALEAIPTGVHNPREAAVSTRRCVRRPVESGSFWPFSSMLSHSLQSFGQLLIHIITYSTHLIHDWFMSKWLGKTNITWYEVVVRAVCVRLGL